LGLTISYILFFGRLSIEKLDKLITKVL